MQVITFQCQSWMRHLTDLLDVCHQNMLNYEENTNYETLAINAEEYRNGQKMVNFSENISRRNRSIRVAILENSI